MDLIGGNQIAFPEFEGPALDRSLIGERAEDEAAVWLQIVVLKKLAPAFERKISAVDEVFVKAVALLVDVVDLVVVFAIDNKHHVWQSVGRVGIVGDCERVKLRLRIDGRQRLWASLGSNAAPAKTAQKAQETSSEYRRESSDCHVYAACICALTRTHEQFYQIVDVLLLGQKAVDVHAHRAAAVQDSRRQPASPLRSIICCKRCCRRSNSGAIQIRLRQKTKTTHRRFHFTHALEICQTHRSAFARYFVRSI